MGKVKAWAEAEFEKSLAMKEKEAGFSKAPIISKEEWVKHGMADQRDWAQYEAEFSAWLDAYEKSFGDNL